MQNVTLIVCMCGNYMLWLCSSSGQPEINLVAWWIGVHVRSYIHGNGIYGGCAISDHNQKPLVYRSGPWMITQNVWWLRYWSYQCKQYDLKMKWGPLWLEALLDNKIFYWHKTVLYVVLPEKLCITGESIEVGMRETDVGFNLFKILTWSVKLVLTLEQFVVQSRENDTNISNFDLPQLTPKNKVGTIVIRSLGS